MKKFSVHFGVLATALGVSSLVPAFGFQAKVGDHAPSFSVTSMSGKQLFFKDMQTGGPVFVYFIRDGDSISQRTTEYINQIIKAYGASRTTFYGVVNDREDRSRSYMAEANPAFRLERDENLSAVKAFGVTTSPTIFEFSSKGLITHVWKGFSGVNLSEINNAYAKASRKSVQTIDFSGAPSTAQYGVDYMSVTKSSG